MFATWQQARPQAWRDRIDVVAMDGVTGFKTAATEQLPDVTQVMDPFHVIQLDGDGLDRCRQRVQQATCGHRGRKGDPLYGVRRTLHTGADLLTGKQQARLEQVFADAEHVEVEITRGVYQDMVAAYRNPDRASGLSALRTLIGKISAGVPTALAEIVTLGRTMKRRADDILAYFDRPDTSNGQTE